MSRRTMIAISSAISALNLVALAANLSLPSTAAVAATNYRELANDPDFTRAVQSIVQSCKVNIDTARLTC